MIQSKDPQTQNLIAVLIRQREDALDTVALAMATIATHEATIANLNAKLNQKSGDPGQTVASPIPFPAPANP